MSREIFEKKYNLSECIDTEVIFNFLNGLKEEYIINFKYNKRNETLSLIDIDCDDKTESEIENIFNQYDILDDEYCDEEDCENDDQLFLDNYSKSNRDDYDDYDDYDY